ncbi:hypothetical protein [Burkholderia multivorans]|uniref:hypothetical protein n=1 Tax=Burkholderia multivorans TaxID=87883 RepID=UPI0028704010|nr:hypothetical protein [Burkholderia multivorans]
MQAVALLTPTSLFCDPFCSADRHVALARQLHVQRCNRKRLHTAISVRGAAKTRVMLWWAPPSATIAAQQMSTISKTGTVRDVLEIYGLFVGVIFSRHFIF